MSNTIAFNALIEAWGALPTTDRTIRAALYLAIPVTPDLYEALTATFGGTVHVTLTRCELPPASVSRPT